MQSSWRCVGLAGALVLVGCDGEPSERTSTSAQADRSQSSASSVGPGSATPVTDRDAAASASASGALGSAPSSTMAASAAPAGETTSASSPTGALVDVVAELGATDAATVTFERRLTIGARPKLELPVAAGWRGSTLCFGLDGDPLLFAQSHDKQALVVVLPFCALTAPRCGADAYLTQVGGAANIVWAESTPATLGAARWPVTVLRGRCTMQGRAARLWQLLDSATGRAAPRTPQILIALDSEALPERRNELAHMLGSLVRDEQGAAPALDCGAESRRRRAPTF